MSDIHPESTEKTETPNPEKETRLSPTGISAVQNAQADEQAYINEQQKYFEDLWKHKTDMQEKGNLKAVQETEAEIDLVDQRLYEAVQKKHGIPPDQDAKPKA